MKKQVNAIWYNQYLKWNDYEQKEDIRLVKLQHERFFNYPMPFDLELNISEEKVKEYLKDAVERLGTAKERRKQFLSTYEPNDQIKPDFKRIEAYIKRNASKINRTMDIKSKWDFYAVVSRFFCEARWGLPQSERNNDRVFDLMNKYCEGY